MYWYGKSTLLIFIILLLSACGFHLRGVIELPPELSPLYLNVQQADHALSRELEVLLLVNDVVLAESSNEAAAVLTIKQTTKSRRVLSVDSSGRVQEYELSYLVTYNLKTGRTEGTDKSVNLKRDLLFDPTSVLAVDSESEKHYDDMAGHGARLILQQLQAAGKTLERETENKNPVDEAK